MGWQRPRYLSMEMAKVVKMVPAMDTCVIGYRKYGNSSVYTSELALRAEEEEIYSYGGIKVGQETTYCVFFGRAYFLSAIGLTQHNTVL